MLRRQLRNQILDGQNGQFFDDSGTLLLSIGRWSLKCRITEDEMQTLGTATTKWVPVKLALEISDPRPRSSSRLTGNLHLPDGRDIPVTLELTRHHVKGVEPATSREALEKSLGF